MILVTVQIEVRGEDNAEDVAENIKENLSDALGNSPYDLEMISCVGREVDDEEQYA